MLKKFAFIVLLFSYSCSTSDEKKEEKSAIVMLSEKIKEKNLSIKDMTDKEIIETLLN